MAAVDQGIRIRILVNESIKERIEREIFTRSSSDLIEIQLLDKGATKQSHNCHSRQRTMLDSGSKG